MVRHGTRLIDMKGKDSHKIGTLSELKVATAYASLGYSIWFPLETQSKTDLIVEVKGTLTKLQVKTLTENPVNGVVYLQARLLGSPTKYGAREYCEEDFDYLVCVYKDLIWPIPYEIIENKKSLTLGKLFEGRIVRTRSDFNPEDYKLLH